MDLTGFRERISALTQLATGLSKLQAADEHIIGVYQADLLDGIKRAEQMGCSRKDLLVEARTLIQLIVQLAERDDLSLSHEVDALIAEYDGLNQPIKRVLTLSRSRPLRAFPREPLVKHSVFVDESGTGSFDDHAQPVMSLTGVLVEDSQSDAFDIATHVVLERHGLPGDTEIHAAELLANEGPLAAKDPEGRYEFLKSFIQLGLSHALGVHYIGMLKPMVDESFRSRLAARGLDAYTTNVLWFNLTLQAAAIRAIGVSKYHYYFDRTDKYKKDIRRILRALKVETNRGLKISAVEGDPTQVDSREHRFIQLADVLGYFLTRHRQIEVKTFKAKESLKKHEPKILDVYELIRPKLMSFAKDRMWMLVDWTALQDWSPPSKRNRP